MDENRIIKLRDTRDLVGDEIKIDFNPPNLVINYIDLLMTADEVNNMNKRNELNSKLKSKILLLDVWKYLFEGDII